MEKLIDSFATLIEVSSVLFPFMVIGAVVLLLKHRNEIRTPASHRPYVRHIDDAPRSK